MGGKGQGSSLQEGVSHIYKLRLGLSKISILYKKKIKKNFGSIQDFWFNVLH